MKRLFVVVKCNPHKTLLLLLIAVLGICAAINMRLPGLYMDAVNPDYYVTRFFVRNDNSIWSLISISIPLLPQLYHGSLNALLELPFYAVLGGSVLTIRILNTCLLALCAVLIFKLLCRSGHVAISFACCLLFCANIGTIMSGRTQFYMFLPGTAMLLASLFLIKKESKHTNRDLLFAGILAGLSFYSYFVFVFFAPALVLMACVFKNSLSKRRVLAGFGFGYLVGVSPFLIGYLLLFLTPFPRAAAHALPVTIVIICGLIILFSGPIRYFFKAESAPLNTLVRKPGFYRIYFYIAIFIIAIIFCGTVWLAISGEYVKILDLLKLYLSPADPTGAPLSLPGKIARSAALFADAMQLRYIQNAILGKTVLICTGLYPLIFGIAQGIVLLLALLKKASGLRGWILSITPIISFFVFSLPFISRMGEHHFTVVYILSFFAFGGAIGVILSSISSRRLKIAVKTLCAVCLCAILLVNLINFGRYMTELERTGGVSLYTEEINHLASQAAAEREQGIRACYFFPEWGFFMGFAYLTENKVYYRSHAPWPELLNELSPECDKIKLCFWEKENLETYKAIFADSGMEILEKAWMNRSGGIAFYCLEWEGSPI